MSIQEQKEFINTLFPNQGEVIPVKYEVKEFVHDDEGVLVPSGKMVTREGNPKFLGKVRVDDEQTVITGVMLKFPSVVSAGYYSWEMVRTMKATKVVSIEDI